MIDGPLAQPYNPFTAGKRAQAPEEVMRNLQESLNDKIVAVFANPHGIQLLDLLDDMYVRQPVAVPGQPEGASFVREGENRIIRKFRAAVNKAAGNV